MEEQGQRDDCIASERARSEDMEMRQQEFRIMNMLAMQLASNSNNNQNNRLFFENNICEVAHQSVVSHHLYSFVALIGIILCCFLKL